MFYVYIIIAFEVGIVVGMLIASLFRRESTEWLPSPDLYSRKLDGIMREIYRQTKSYPPPRRVK